MEDFKTTQKPSTWSFLARELNNENGPNYSLGKCVQISVCAIEIRPWPMVSVNSSRSLGTNNAKLQVVRIPL